MRRGILRELEAEAMELNVPTGTVPVAAAALVICVHCGRRVPLHAADVVGLGYRCAGCTVAAEVGELVGAPDVADHLSAEDRARFAQRGKEIAVKAAVVSAIMAAVAIVLFAVAPGGGEAWLKLFVAAVTLLFAVGGFGLERWRRFR
jgi:hypothetical protein